ncbi:hypothetical protein Mapa_006154 [Marchantia paleacea]|nr:hypothetical protein Mapa_006154 [Marchantia paleacea]
MIFEDADLSSIVKTSLSPYTDMTSKWFENGETFTSSVVVLTLSEETSVKVAEVHAMSFYSKTYVEKGSDLFNSPLKSDFLKDVENLPIIPQNPESDLSWSPHRDFMNKWGSHIV